MGALLDSSVWDGKLFSNGWVPAAQTIEDDEPATGEILTRVGLATPEEVREAAQVAKAAQPAWAATDFEARAAVFRKAASLMEQHAEEITPLLVRETGSIPPKVGVELHGATLSLWDAAAMLTQPQGVILPSANGITSLAKRVPHGVVGIISPFNFPLILSMRAVAPALATGNTVVLKPDPQTAIAGGFLIARIFEEAGLPEGCLHVLPGDAVAGEALVTDPDVAMVSFTGSTAVGRRVGELAGKHLKKVTLELGGKNPLIVLDDADLDLAASNVAWGCYLHQGQICMTTGRVIVHRDIARDLVDRLVEKANHLPVGNPATEQVALGPIISHRQVARIHSIVQDSVSSGAALKAGGTFKERFYQPTVLAEVKPGMRAFEEEIFGPVASVTTFGSDEEAVALANGTEYGLSAGVISRSVERAQKLGEQLHVGILHINDQTVADDMINPFGGVGASGNGGRHGGPANWEEFTHWQWVTIKNRPTPYPF
jgi:benzaldehyde dehydrogenase (NAD)